MLVGVLWIYGSTELSQLSSIALIGPGVFVTVIGIGLVLCGVALIFQMVISPPSIEPAEDGSDVAPFRPSSFATALVSVTLPIAIMKPLGFPLTASLVFCGITFAFGSRSVIKDLLIGAALSVTSWFVFRWLGVDLGGFFPLLGL
jgi:putative tricarboxylic transport membrane protein